MNSTDDTSKAPDGASPQTPLGAYLECLAIIGELPPHQRKPVANALASFAQWSFSVLTDCEPDWAKTAAKWKQERDELNESLEACECQVDELTAELADEGPRP